MNDDRLQLTAYIATLITLVVVFTASLIAAVIEHSIIGQLGAFGLGTITGGLIGILRLPSKASAAVGAADSANPPTQGK